MRTAVVKPYRWLAQYYDEVFSPFRRPMDEAREQVLSRILPNVTTACDLACGTGTTALAFVRRSIRTYGVDLSPEMCRAARLKAWQARLPLPVIRADMRNFRLPEPVDLVTCEYDALNHVPRKSDLKKVAGAVARALRPGGHFFFDVNNALGFERYWKGVFWIEKQYLILVMRNGHSAGCDNAWSDVDWFVREGPVWRRHQERVEEVCWSAGEIRESLRQAGFDSVRAWDAAPFFQHDPLITRGCRTIYLARKRGR